MAKKKAPKKSGKLKPKTETKSKPEITAFAAPHPKPTAVTVIGWLFIVFSGFGLLGSIMTASEKAFCIIDNCERKRSNLCFFALKYRDCFVDKI